MRKHFIATALAATALLAACGGANPPAATSGRNSNSSANTAQTSLQHGTSPSANLGVASSHGGEATGAGAASAAKPPVATPELDAKIQKAEAKARASGASDADKKAAAAAYFERADFYRGQGVPMLYRFALADYRCGLRYDPNASGPREKMDEIVGIYQGMNKPVPEVGCN